MGSGTHRFMIARRPRLPGRDAVAMLGGLLLGLAAVLAAPPALAAAHPDFTGLWQVADTHLVVRPDVNATEADYTPEAWAKLQEYRRNWDPETEDPAKFCVAYGMPNTMTSRARDYVVDVYQTPARITVLVEFMDNRRLIHLDRKTVPDTATPSNNGYSVARWEGNALVIETTNLKARSEVGPMQRSERAGVVERWTLRNDKDFGQVLDIDMTVTDPVVFRHPVKARQVFKRAPRDATLNEYACADTLWDDYVTKKRAQRASGGKAP